MKNFAFVDASNLFYGGEKSLGWKVDYQKLLNYLRDKYKISKALYFGGVEIHSFKFDYLINDTVPISDLEKYLPVLKYLKGQRKEITILASGPRTAREIRQFAGGNFRDFVRLEKYIKFEEK